MKIKAKIGEWSRIMEVPSDYMRRGVIEIVIMPPLDKLVPSSKKILKSDTVGVKVCLQFTTIENGLHVFEFIK